MAVLPSGRVTFLFSDIEDCRRLWEQFPSRMEMALVLHDCHMRQAIASHGGYLFRKMEDACCAAFSSAREALAAALEAKMIIASTNWSGLPIRVRIALNTGPAGEQGGDYFGPTPDCTSRMLSDAPAGQILVSETTCQALWEEGEAMTMDEVLVYG